MKYYINSKTIYTFSYLQYVTTNLQLGGSEIKEVTIQPTKNQLINNDLDLIDAYDRQLIKK